MKKNKDYMLYAIMQILEENYQVNLSAIKGIDIFESVKRDFEKKCEDKEYYLELAKDFFELYELKGEINLEELLFEPACDIQFYGKVIEIRSPENTLLIHVGKKGEILISKVLVRTRNEI